MKHLKKLLYLLVGVFSLNINAQTLHVNNGDGTTSSYSIEDIRRITIDEPNLVVLLFNGDSFSFPLSNLQNYRYDEGSLSLTDALGEINKWEVKLFPNPTSSELSIRFNLSETANISYQILDANGKLINSTELGVLSPGEHEFSADFSNLPVGSYAVNILRDGMVYTKKIIKQ